MYGELVWLGAPDQVTILISLKSPASILDKEITHMTEGVKLIVYLSPSPPLLTYLFFLNTTIDLRQ